MSKEFIKLSAGDPDVEAPDYVKKAILEAIKQGGPWTHYASQSNYSHIFKKAVVDYYKKFAGANYQPINVVPTAGSSAALYIALNTVLDPGDEILMFEPTYRGHFRLLDGMKIKQNILQMEREDNYHPDIDKIAECITPKTKAVIVCNPNNPTGTVFTAQELRAIGDYAVDNDMAILSDEIYLHFVYDDNKFVSTAHLSEKYQERTINIMSFSKTFSMTGWRLGYIIVPEMFLEKAEKINSMVAPRPATFIYAAGTAALKGDFKYVEERCQAYNNRRDYFCPAINELDQIECDLFEGSFYAWFNVKRTGLGSQDFCDKLRSKENLQYSPGHTFGPHQDGFIRVPLVKPVEILKDAVQRTKNFMDSL